MHIKFDNRLSECRKLRSLPRTCGKGRCQLQIRRRDRKRDEGAYHYGVSKKMPCSVYSGSTLLSPFPAQEIYLDGATSINRILHGRDAKSLRKINKISKIVFKEKFLDLREGWE